MNNVCIFSRLSMPGLGDLIQRNTMLHLVREAYPEARIVVVTTPALIRRFATFYLQHSYVDAVIPCPEIADRSLSSWRAFDARLRREQFAACVVDYDSRGLNAFHAWRSAIPTRIGFVQGRRTDTWLTVPIRFEQTKVSRPDLFDFAVAYARALGISRPLQPSTIVPRFRFRAEPLPELTVPHPIVAVHPGGAAHWNRRWPLEHYQQICSRLIQERGAVLYLLGGFEEREDIAALRRSLLARHPRALIFDCSGSTLNQTANYLSVADLFVGNDSGPMHLASVLDVPTVVVYGPSGTAFQWMRIYPRHRGVSKRYACQRIVHFAEQWTTMPCEYACPYTFDPELRHYPRCLSDITVDEVWQAVVEQLSGGRSSSFG